MSIHPATISTLWSAIGALEQITAEDIQHDPAMRQAVGRLAEQSMLLVDAVRRRDKEQPR